MRKEKDIFDHPGNLGPVRGSLLAIHHGDWPAYPEGENFSEALLQFTAFPPGTKFIVIDDIDCALLFIADVKCAIPEKPFDTRNFHIAAWHEDLAELQRRGFIEGIKPITERQWHKRRWDALLSDVPEGSSLGFKDASGNFVPLKPPSFEDYEDNEDWTPFVCSPDRRIKVTKSGRDSVYATIKSQGLDITYSISAKVGKLYELGFFDTCIREACVQLEHEIKVQIRSESWGDRLTEAFINYIQEQERFLESGIRTFRQELRSVFKMIRNDYMHNLSEVDETSALVVLLRISRVRSMLENAQKPGVEL